MSDATAIEWTDATWNPTTGCDQVSPGCDNCYALTLAARLKKMGSPAYQEDGDPRTSGPGFKLTLHPDRLDQPLRWTRPRRIFVNSMSDLFHPDVPESFIADVWGVMLLAAHKHEFQILTKRPQRMRQILGDRSFYDLATELANQWDIKTGNEDFDDGWQIYFGLDDGLNLPQPLVNAWLGTSIESDRYTFRADHLRNTPAAVRFLSLEPLLGPLPSLDLHGIDWVIVGGESGPNHRPIDPDWVRDIRDRCIDADVPFFFKQWGGRTPKAGGRELDGRTWDEYPVVA